MGPSPVDRAIDLLEALAFDESGRPLRLTDLASRLDLHPSTAYRLLKRLVDRGLVERVGDHYAIGLRAFELGSSWDRGVSLARHAKPIMGELVARVNETAHLGVLEDADVVYIEKVESSHVVHTRSRIGRRMPAHSTGVGKALLAFLDPAELDQRLPGEALPRRTRNTLVTRAALDADLAATRSRGFAIDHSENEDGVRCVGAPVFGHESHVIAALSLSAPVQRFPVERVDELAALIVEAANALSALLGRRADDERVAS